MHARTLHRFVLFFLCGFAAACYAAGPPRFNDQVDPKKVGGDFRAHFKTNDAALKTILADAGILVDNLGQASLDPSVPVTQRAPNNEHQNAAKAWNTIYTGYQNLVADAQPLSRLMKVTANVFTDYTFAQGRFKGLKVDAGFNYRGKQVLGYRASDTIAGPANPTFAIDDPKVGPYNTVEADPYYAAVRISDTRG